MSTITYVIGDATQPTGEGPRVICHVCNDIGAWGAGFVMALSRRWIEPERMYREHSTLLLGEVMCACVEDDVVVANMVAQHGFPTAERPVAINYSSLEECLTGVAALCVDSNASAHMPRIGCGIAGGDWETVARIIQKTLCARGVAVTAYDLPIHTKN